MNDDAQYNDDATPDGAWSTNTARPRRLLRPTTTRPGGPDELDYSDTICGGVTRSGGRCRRAPVPGARRCKFHGGASPRGPAQRSFRHGGYSAYANPRLGKLIDAVGSVDDYVSQRREIELLRARVVELVEALSNEADPGVQAWRRTQVDAKALVEALESKDESAALNLARAIADRSTRAVARDVAWRSLEASLRTLTKLCDNERRVVEALHNAVTVSDWKRLMTALVIAVVRQVEDDDLKRRLGETLMTFLRYQSAGDGVDSMTRKLLVTRDAEPTDLTPLYRELRLEAEGMTIDREYGVDD